MVSENVGFYGILSIIWEIWDLGKIEPETKCGNHHPQPRPPPTTAIGAGELAKNREDRRSSGEAPSCDPDLEFVGEKLQKWRRKEKKITVIIASLPDPVVSRRQSMVLFRSASSPSFLQSKQLFCHLHRFGSRSSKYFPVKSTCICFCQKSNMLLFIQKK